MMCNLHWCYIFAPLLHLDCTALSQSESSNFFVCIINFDRARLTTLRAICNISSDDRKEFSGDRLLVN